MVFNKSTYFAWFEVEKQNYNCGQKKQAEEYFSFDLNQPKPNFSIKFLLTGILHLIAIDMPLIIKY